MLLDGGKPNPSKDKKPSSSYPQQVGNWKLIYPFDDFTRKQSEPCKVGHPNMKTIVNNIKKLL